jgi:hypothetical protein
MSEFISHSGCAHNLLLKDTRVHKIVDHFRCAMLGLPTVPHSGGQLLRHFNIPHTYLWSSALIQKPID